MEHQDLIKEIESTRDNFHKAFMEKDWVRITEQIVHDDSIKFYNDAISLITNIANRHEVLVRQGVPQPVQTAGQLERIKIGKALDELIATIYFADNSDYSKAIWDAIKELDEEAYNLLEESPSKAYAKYCGR